jgi:hypothetical protein
MPDGDTTGYTIKLSAYGHDGMVALLERAKTIFNDNALGTPDSFREGGWTADVTTLQALADEGFVADASALNWAKIQEEWEGYELATWTMQHWTPIGDTSQPYYPSTTNVLGSDPAPTMSILELPDNGAMIDYVTNQEMSDLFTANWDGTPLEAPHTLVMGWHPAPTMPLDEYRQLDTFFRLTDQHLAASGAGPVVYMTLKDVIAAFPGP